MGKKVYFNTECGRMQKLYGLPGYKVWNIFQQNGVYCCDDIRYYDGVLTEEEALQVCERYHNSKWLRANIKCTAHLIRFLDKILVGFYDDFVNPQDDD